MLHLMIRFITKCLAVNRNGEDHADGTSIMALIIAILENMQGRINAELAGLMGIVLEELAFCRGKDYCNKFQMICLQAFASFYTYDAKMTFEIIA